MSCKLALLFLVAFVGYQSASATFHLNGKSIHDCKNSALYDPLDHPVTFVGKIINLRPIRVIRRVLLFPLKVILKVLRVVLTPIRILLLPLHLIHRVVRVIFFPVKAVARFVMNVLLSLPVIRIAARACVGVWRLLTFPVRAVHAGYSKVLGH